jgi:hypothetical protein
MILCYEVAFNYDFSGSSYGLNRDNVKRLSRCGIFNLHALMTDYLSKIRSMGMLATDRKLLSAK